MIYLLNVNQFICFCLKRAVTHILLLKKGEYSPTMLKVFKEDDLDNMAKELRKEFIAGDRFDKDLKVEIEKLLEVSSVYSCFR